MKSINCPICGSDEYKKITNKGQHNIHLSVVICQKCGFVYLNPRWSKKRYDIFYEKDYDKFYGRKNSNNEFLNKIKYETINKRINEKLNNLIINNIIDIGAGEGSLLRLFSRDYDIKQLYAIEQSNLMRKKLNKKNINVISSDVDTKWEKNINHNFDFIIMRHVLEHFLNPNEVLKKTNKVLSDNGYCYIAVPNMNNPKNSLYNNWFRVVHVSYFNLKTLKYILLNNGFEIIDFGKGNESDNPGEIWVLCKKAESTADLKNGKLLSDNYNKQMKILRKKRIKEPFYSFYRFTKNMLGKTPIGVLLKKIKHKMNF